MIRTPLLSLLFCLSSWSVANACSIMPPLATTQPSYENILAKYSGEVYRNLVDTSDNIVIGKFKYSKKHKSHQLYISKNLKRTEYSKEREKVNVTFSEVSDDRVNYIRPEPSEFPSTSSTKLFYPVNREPHLDGSYGPGDCGIALDISKGSDYIVFSDKDFTVKTTFILTKDNSVLEEAFTHLIETPTALKGIAFSLAYMLEEGVPIELLETSSCSPKPIYKVLGSSDPAKKSNFLEAEPILVFSEKQANSIDYLAEEVMRRAENSGLIQGKYTNAPALDKCEVGQKYLSIGAMFYARDYKASGQMIEEEIGYFDLSQTVFENAFYPETISVDAATKLLANTPK